MKIKELKPQKNPRLPDEADSEVWQEAVKGVRKIKNSNLDLSKPAPKEFIIRENVNVFEAYGGEDLSFLIPGLPTILMQTPCGGLSAVSLRLRQFWICTAVRPRNPSEKLKIL